MRTLAVLAVLLVSSTAFAQPYYQQQPRANQFHDGLTFEANLGLGLIWSTVEGSDESSDSELAVGLGLGLGGWVSPRLAISARLAGVSYSDECSVGSDDTCTLNSTFFGPSLQYWVNEQVWFGGGIGVSVARTFRNASDEDGVSEEGLGLDLRAGYSFSAGGQSTFNISVEYTPGFYTFETIIGDFDYTIHGFGILFGYQHF
jgi:hypothetical protein